MNVVYPQLTQQQSTFAFNFANWNNFKTLNVTKIYGKDMLVHKIQNFTLIDDKYEKSVLRCESGKSNKLIIILEIVHHNETCNWFTCIQMKYTG